MDPIKLTNASDAPANVPAPPPNAPAPQSPEKPTSSQVRFKVTANVIQRIASSVIGIHAPGSTITDFVIEATALKQYVDAGALQILKADKLKD